MVIRKMPCTMKGCNGVMIIEGGDARAKRIKYRCGKCGHIETIPRSNVEAGRHTFQLSDPSDPLRGQIK